MKRLLACVLIGFVLMLVLSELVMAQAHVGLPVELEGTLNRADYKIRVPINWNGTLLVYAHGYTGELPAEPDAAPGGAMGEETLLSRGYALAGSSFRGTGWAEKAIICFIPLCRLSDIMSTRNFWNSFNINHL